MSAVTASLTRITALILRHMYLLRGSWARMAELVYWPTVQLCIWGFFTNFFTSRSPWLEQAFGVLIAGVLLWEITVRSQIGVCLAFLEEIWSRNLGSLFVTPLRPLEFAASLASMGMIRVILGVGPAAIIALLFYDYSLFAMGPILLLFFSQLILMGWAMGIALSGVVLRVGLGAENLAWMGTFILAPIAGIYYPVDSLPGWIQPISYALPAAHVFEGMRAVMFGKPVPWNHLLAAIGLNAVYMIGAGFIFHRCFNAARKAGKLLQTGE